LIYAAPLLVGFLVAIRASEVIGDNSFLWHIRAGSVQLEAGRVLTVDPFSFTASGESWRTQSWLVDLLYAVLERTSDSLTWVNWFVFVTGLIVLGLVGVAMYAANRSPIVLAGGLIVAAWLFAPFAQPRPVIVSYVFLAALVIILARRDQLMWALVPLFWLWAGVHGSWALGGALVVLELIRTRDLRLLKVGLVSLVATALTAHGIGSWIVLYEFAQARDALALISEWMPPDFGDIAQGPYLIVIAGLFVGYARGKLDMRDLVVILPFLFFGMTSRRAVFPAAVVLFPFAISGIAPLHVRSAVNARIVSIGVMAAIGAAAFVPMLTRPLGVLDVERFPQAKIVASIRGLRAFHDSAVGGYLIYAAWPDQLVYIDDRAELFGLERMQEFARAREGDYVDVFDRYDIEAAVVRPKSALFRQLSADGWSPLAVTDEFVTMLP